VAGRIDLREAGNSVAFRQSNLDRREWLSGSSWNIAITESRMSASAADVSYVTATRSMVGQLCANPPGAV
jgi:hypothetical protein